MPRTETVTLTNMCMVYDDSGKVLVQDRIDPDWPGITFPGGHVEKGESFTDAVIREVLEETGLTVKSPRLCGIKDWTSDSGIRYMVLLYKADKFCGTLKSSDEGEVYWVSQSELPRMKLADGMDKMLKVFFDEDISEYFFCKENGIWTDILK